MSYFAHADLISSLLNPRLVNPGSTLIYVGAFDPSVSCYVVQSCVLQQI